MNFVKQYQPVVPRNFIGDAQNQTARRLEAAILAGEPIKPQLFAGKPGTGKTSMVRMMLSLLESQGKQVDFISHHSTTLGNKADVENLVEHFQTMPIFGDIKFYLLEEVHRLSSYAQDILLIPLEEIRRAAPPWLIITAATSMPEKLTDALLSRFDQNYFYPPPAPAMDLLITAIANREGLTISSTQRQALINAARGNVRTLVTSLELLAKDGFAPRGVAEIEPDIVQMLKIGDLQGLLRLQGDYLSLLLQANSYALRVLETQPTTKWARAVVYTFGKGLNPNVPNEEIAFGNLMVEYIDKLNQV